MTREQLIETNLCLIQFNNIMDRASLHQPLMNTTERMHFLYNEWFTLSVFDEQVLQNLMESLVREDVLDEEV